MLWFNFILGLNFIFLCFKLIILHYYYTPKTKEIKYKPRIKLNHNIYADGSRDLISKCVVSNDHTLGLIVLSK